MESKGKIFILDQVGLGASITQNALKELYYAFEYFPPAKATAALNTLVTSFGSVQVLLLVDAALFHRVKRAIPRNLQSNIAVALVGTREQAEDISELGAQFYSQQVIDFLEIPLSAPRFELLLHRTQAHFQQRLRFDILRYEITEQREELEKLNDIGVALSSEQDISKLLEIILSITVEITGADAGSLYIVEEKPGVDFDPKNPFRNKQLRFRHAQNISRDVPFKEWVMPIGSNSIVGHAAISGQPLNLPDVYMLPADVPYSFGGRAFDQSLNYRTKSMLTVPMLNRSKEAIGVIQLMNKKRDYSIMLPDPDEAMHYILPFTHKDETFIYSLASQAAVAYENRLLYDSIRTLFEGFIKASVTAIEARDPTTSGHSERVAILTVGVAEVADKIQTGFFKDVKFTKQDFQEIKYASLLHDFGKIGVREPVLVKAKKLYDDELRAIKDRYTILKKAVELKYTKQKVHYLLERSREEAEALIKTVDKDCFEKLAELDDYLAFITKTNEPSIMKTGGFEKLKDIQSKIFAFNDDEVYSYLTESEAHRLSIPKGSLDAEERLEIESHVSHTYNFLKQIPWTNDLRRVPHIAHAHHEKLDGTGYPLQLPKDAIPVQSRMMTIADIYDALTAQDRPYKPAVPIDRALDILNYEVKGGKVDKELFELFIDSKVYELTLQKIEV
jgi:HD-GYP domain-containing protein (c-di-GMP phosphodiesterase class II)